MSTALPKYLLAKSYPQTKPPQQPPDYALLLQHSRDVAQACTALVEVIGRLVLERAGLTETDIEAFKKAMAAVGWFEDLGKANSHFQEMVTKAPQLIQLLRHETLSGLLLWRREMRKWLKPALGEWFIPALWAAMGHHRKFARDTQASNAPALTVWLNHPDFQKMLAELGECLGLESPPTFLEALTIAPDNRNPNAVSARRALQNLKKYFNRLWKQLAPEWSKRLAVMKALGIAADVAASAVAASAVAAQGQSAANYSLDTFVRETLGHVGLDAADFDRLIGEWAWKATGQTRPSNAPQLPPGFASRPFQLEVATSKSFVTLACAGCGSGKSLAAYLWAQAWQQRAGQTNFRLFFCLPTTGTTTEHFKDYALEAGLPAALTHSRSTVDLKALAETADQESECALDDLRDKIEALSLWDTPLVVTTADTVLGLMANARRSLYAFPAIALSAIVFDEIHAFDDRLFGHLLAFLRFFPRQPVLLMTASLPQHRLAALQNVRPDLQIVAGPAEYEQLPRYELRYPSSPKKVWQAVAKCIAKGGKVLWVRNRVEWANKTYASCRKRFPRKRFPKVEVNVYHSRFRYKDRSRLHHYVIGKFKGEDAQILVTTQVAEMSLDLSADLLITDIASVPALIQRMGRANRRSTPECPQPPKPVLVCPLPPQANERDNPALPYEAEDIATAKGWLAHLLALKKPLSQRDLADAFGSLSPGKDFDVEQAWEAACFVSGGWETRPGMTRSEGYTVNVILEADWKAYGQSKPGRDWLIEHEVAIPFRTEVLRWETVGSHRLAPAKRVAYDFNPKTKKGTGARWVSAQPATD